jgi:ribosomal-protein-alanine N-acetyltransferase
MDVRLATELRPARASDISALVRIEAAAFSDPWPASGFRSLLDARTTRMTVAERDGELLGYSVVIVVQDEAELANIAVAEQARGEGIGRQLLTAVLNAARVEGVASMYLEVRESNTAARSLYESLGFAPVGRRRRYYQEPDEDALVLVWRAGAGG